MYGSHSFIRVCELQNEQDIEENHEGVGAFRATSKTSSGL